MRVLAAFCRPSSVMIASTMPFFSSLLTLRGSRRLAATSNVSRTYSWHTQVCTTGAAGASSAIGSRS